MRRTVLAGLLALMAIPALAHEFWLSPSTFRPKVGEIVSIKTLVGDNYVGESRPRDPTKLESFVLATPQGDTRIVGRDGGDPAGLVRIGSTGTFAVGYRSKNTRVVLEGGKFEGYLKDKGLDHAAAARAKAGITAEDGRERFSRCAKMLLCVGDTPSSGFDHNFGFPLELIPAADPYTLHAGDSLTVKLLSGGKPAENVLVTACAKGDPKKTISARTDKDGQAAFRLETAGEWLFNAVTISPVTEKDADVEWESLWASLTFDLAPKEERTSDSPTAAAPATDAVK